ncbi:putative 3-hydroxyisobutyryl-CoA hydrolase-like protein 2, mitochondrial [Cocos nucifera]|uniref:3-hydroxyisobutyryl-CoA hydrolase n=1 Tax=Cocos nucifera TaxID=13894 RepID=A0A8K0IEL6_COCNU|nr:putative 3-hydroxyisobutyryl-CoA hydrolase-like protein 2, mitochondrial [Cocos nucifera]
MRSLKSLALARRSLPALRFVSNRRTLSTQPSAAQDDPLHNEVLVEGKASARAAILNRPSALNALTTNMALRLKKLYESWEDNPDIGFVIMKGSGRAFCAGGDVVALYRLLNEGKMEDCKDFFRNLYMFIYILGTYLKPHVAILDGVTMGGGAGVSVPGAFRIATDKTVGTSGHASQYVSGCLDMGQYEAYTYLNMSFMPVLTWFGEYLALTGEGLNGIDMLAVGLATHYSMSDRLNWIDERLAKLVTDDPSVIDSSLAQYGDIVYPDKKSIFHRLEVIDKCFGRDTVEEIVDALESEAARSNQDWCTSALKKLKEASPLSLKVTLRSGVRARLVDKDLAPKWDPPTLEQVPDDMVDYYFSPLGEFPPTAATVSSSLLLGISGLPDTKFRSAIETALADGECYEQQNPNDRLSCFYDKVSGLQFWVSDDLEKTSNFIGLQAMVNVGADLVKLVPGRVSTEVDARLAYDTHGIVRKVRDLLNLYYEIEVPSERLLFKIPSTWQGIEASRVLESEGIQTHLTFVYSFAQAAAAAQAGASVIQIFVGRIRDWSRNHSGDPEIEAACKKGEDPGLALVTKAYNYIHKYGHRSKLMAAAIRNKQDIFSLLGVDYIIAPLKILQSLKESLIYPDEKYSFVRRMSPSSATAHSFSEEELVNWDQESFSAAMGPGAKELLASGLEGYVNQAQRLEELLGKIWPPPNV